jgi:carbonic anhydrase
MQLKQNQLASATKERRFKMKILLIAALMSVAAFADSPPQKASTPLTRYRERLDTATPKSVYAWLAAGNERFAKGASTHGGYLSDTRERIGVSAKGQRPLAVVLSCIDSRTTPELIFDTSVGDLFTARVGANVVNDDILGSLEIAVESGAHVLVVLGHTNCGGVTAACDNLQLGHMTQLLERVKPAITATHKHLDENPVLSAEVGERVISNRRYIAEVSHMNAQQSALQILERSPLLKEKVKNKELILVSALYDVDSGKVLFDPIQD